ncbi:hypothetical protein RIVM261_083940 [Rivularia sp. IAM M-261]|nr:hypothetical protein RIVM261_083940 [Rivularia sp. IAM M-261]
MLIQDLSYVEISNESVQIEGGVSPFDAVGFSGSFDKTHMAGIKTVSSSGAGGTVTGSESINMSRFTGGATFVGWNF